MFTKIIKTLDEERKNTLGRIGKSRGVARRILREATLHEHLALRAKVSLVANRKLRNMAACMLDTRFQPSPLRLATQVRVANPRNFATGFKCTKGVK